MRIKGIDIVKHKEYTTSIDKHKHYQYVLKKITLILTIQPEEAVSISVIGCLRKRLNGLQLTGRVVRIKTKGDIAMKVIPQKQTIETAKTVVIAVLVTGIVAFSAGMVAQKRLESTVQHQAMNLAHTAALSASSDSSKK